ncbi:MAG: 30S ribosome-binding factor RbfA [Fibrobacteres bacterium]|nr:30S ribosome-binding factor RbfA [Fibrobacterota bacterium]
MGIRPKRVEDSLLRAVTEVLQRKVRDPRLSVVTVTSVSISPDLRQARVFVSTFDEKISRNDLMAGLAASASFIRRETARIVQLRNAPELLFIYDDGQDRGDRVLSLLNNLEEHDSGNAEEEHS